MVRDKFKIVDSYLIERDLDATIAYATIHLDLYGELQRNKTKTKEEYVEFLQPYGYCKNDKLYNLNRMKLEKMKQLYHSTLLSKNFGDVANVTASKLDQIVEQYPTIKTFASWSTPCQDFSNAGQRAGFSGVKGNLTHITVDLFRQMKSKFDFLLFENVPAIMDKEFIAGFNKLMFELQKIGYYNKNFKMNAKNYGIPQNRNRVFVASSSNKEFYFDIPKPFPLEIKLKDLLEDEVDEKYFLSEKMKNFLLNHKERHDEKGNGFGFKLADVTKVATTITTAPGSRATDTFIEIKEATQKGYAEASDGDGVILDNPMSKTKRGRVQKELSPTLMTSENVGVVCINWQQSEKFKNKPMIDMAATLSTQNNQAVIEGLTIRKLTPLECARLMDFDDKDYYLLKQMGFADSVIYKLCGNGIVVKVLQYINRNIFNQSKNIARIRNIVLEQQELF